MALFGLGRRGAESPKKGGAQTYPIVGKTLYCRICDENRMFTQCWRRVNPPTKCGCCGLDFENPAALYKKHQPVCPRCAEPLEQPGFDYGLCDGCGSKFEIVEGTKPGLLPNQRQRAEMERHGKSWSQE